MSARGRAVIVLLVVAALAVASVADAGGRGGLSVRGWFSGGDAGVAAGVFGGAALLFGAAGAAERIPGWRDTPLLIVDATPPEAQVYLDGRRLGIAGELVALALPVPPGPHVVHVVAPGYRSSLHQFVADGTFPIRLRAALTPQ